MTVSSGMVVLARHGEPALSRRLSLSPSAYGDWWARYEIGGLKAGQSPPDALVATAAKVGRIIVSPRPRALETAGAVAGGRSLEIDPTFVEAPLPPPPVPGWVRLSPRRWGVLARLWWWFLDHHAGQESRAEAERRAEAAADRLIEATAAGEDVLVVAHGFFNLMVGRALVARGWRLVRNGGFGYWSARYFQPPAA